jgi:hypothetical protein
MNPLDYGLSFITHPGPVNAVRFWVESRTRVIDDEAGASTDYYQCGSCKSEHTFAERDLFKEDNYDFLPIYGGKHLLIIRRPARISEEYRTVQSWLDAWGEPILKLREGTRFEELADWDAIRRTTAAAVPIVSQTEIADEKTGLRAIIECPVKTMNVNLEHQLYQVDTGPVAFADLGQRHDPQILALSLAFVAFNAPHFADFVVEQPTPVIEDETEKCRIYHFSKPFSLPAKNRLLAVHPAR